MIQYNFGAVGQAAEDINATTNNINGLLDNLKADLKPLVSEWEGSSAEAYNAAQRKWDQSAADLNDVLRQVGMAVREANDRMSQINTNAANSWA
ncbi:WXG100 family type VII secretion target [Corynebacterium heidelbergense]|uniref:ESAT-6-like protein n=1 Tax=Corynebacterium heidelbergense TaxID=2055947 RepID=A0A364V782_9CORY|nr:WXG100 family type VII secretion target [Corynebacterium heidelbergense]RAV32505.1 WXG100 family type VII secretion target [Corynebacterium heidelbergense]RAV34421.1 WXG100 family type VII secretion target [Corynebacterium heidelbergense]WCZ37292.1 6 kDa early secretory antigenic target [Corynebacterium heidelbergense]